MQRCSFRGPLAKCDQFSYENLLEEDEWGDMEPAGLCYWHRKLAVGLTTASNYYPVIDLEDE